MNIRVAVAVHKPYALYDDLLYLPLQVGAQGKTGLGWQRDDEGTHISGKNPFYCELTGHYWLWKNMDLDGYGLCHYRRYPATGRFGNKNKRILRLSQAQRMLERCPVWLPKKRHYWIETNYSQYVHAHHAQDLDITRQILAEEDDPRYVQAFDRVMRRRSGHRFNMFLMQKAYFEQYSAWLFEVLARLEERLDMHGYSTADQRVFGYVAERLMDVWLLAEDVPYREFFVANMERQHWGKKIIAFIQRKLRGKRA